MRLSGPLVCNVFEGVYATEIGAGRCPAGAVAVAFEFFQVGLTLEGSDEGIQEVQYIYP
jgi:hypothetical protein